MMAKRELKTNDLIEPFPLQHITRYPARPDALPDNVRTFAFPDGCPPEQDTTLYYTIQFYAATYYIRYMTNTILHVMLYYTIPRYIKRY